MYTLKVRVSFVWGIFKQLNSLNKSHSLSNVTYNFHCRKQIKSYKVYLSVWVQVLLQYWKWFWIKEINSCYANSASLNKEHWAEFCLWVTKSTTSIKSADSFITYFWGLCRRKRSWRIKYNSVTEEYRH